MTGNRLKILQIMETYPPDYGGGAALTAQELGHYLVAQGHHVQALCMGKAANDEYSVVTEYDGEIRVDRMSLPYFKNIDPEGWQLGLRKWRRHQQKIAEKLMLLLAEACPDIVLYHTCRPFGEIGYEVIHDNNVPIIAVLHDGWLVCPRMFFLQSPLSNPCQGPGKLKCLGCLSSHYDNSRVKFALKLPWRMIKWNYYLAYRIWRRAAVTKYLTAAAGVSEFMSQKHRLSIKGEVITLPPSVDTSGLLANSFDQVNRGYQPLRFGFIGGFQPVKGIWHVLDAVQSLKSQGKNFELHLWGPQQESGLKEIKSRRLEDRVVLRGMYSPRELWDVYRQIDVAVMATTVCEPLGRVPLEAAAVGVPTIAPAIGGLKELIRHGVDGLHFEFKNPKDLMKQMQRVLDEPELVESLSRNLPLPIHNDSRGEALEQLCQRVVARQARQITL